MQHDPLHGVTLERMLNELVEWFGWERMGRRIRIACFTSDPSVSSSLKFLRKTPWARAKVEALYIEMAGKKRTRAEEASAPRLHDDRDDDAVAAPEVEDLE